MRGASAELVASSYSPVLALDNVEHTADLFAFKLAAASKPALIVGNERFGISHDMVSTAEHILHLPMTKPRLDTVNVSAAAAVALYYLTAGIGARMPMRADPPRLRPEVLLIGGADYFELGCSIRAAATFGWERLFIEDRESVWFGQGRVAKASELSSDARSARDSIRTVPVKRPSKLAFNKATIVTRQLGIPLHLGSLAEGPKNLIVIPDESNVDILTEDWSKYGNDIEFVKIEVPQEKYIYHYRLFSTIALAEISRQVGQRAPSSKPANVKQGKVFDSVLAKLLTQKSEFVFLDDLSSY